MPSRGNYLDLDPTYKDNYGRPLLRMTFDFPTTTSGCRTGSAEQVAKIAKSLNPKILTCGNGPQGLEFGALSKHP